MDAAIIPFFEHIVERHAESVLRWSHQNLTASHVQDVPEELRQETLPAPSVLSKFLFPSFLSRGPRPAGAGREEVPEEIAREIRRRVERARKEIEIEQRESQVRSRGHPSDQLKGPPSRNYNKRKIEERIRKGEFPKGPRIK